MYDVDYFIDKFEKIPEELWCISIRHDGGGRSCAYGHCRPSAEMDAFRKLDLTFSKHLAVGSFKA
jgi:hypothetical protein